MSRALVTFAVGPEHERLLEIALPSFEAFADRHGYALLDMSGMIVDEERDRPASWYKLLALQGALRTWDEALWLDADTVIVDPSEDLDVPAECWQALVEHRTPDGAVPNLGVWLVRRPMIPVLEQMWGMTEYLHHGWWEQAAMHELLGYGPARPVALGAPTALNARTWFLAPGWNVHPWDANPTDRERIMHATMHPDREAMMRAWAMRTRAALAGT